MICALSPDPTWVVRGLNRERGGGGSKSFINYWLINKSLSVD